MTRGTEDWVSHSKNALQWFIDIIGEGAWEKRRKNVIDYFISIYNLTHGDGTTHSSSIDELFKPVAVYDDWMAWYMYLIESLVIRPHCGDPVQSARIYPFFAAIGRNIEGLKRMNGIKDRLTILLNDRNNKPDSTLFELIVAACYYRNGWKVAFIPEIRSKQTPDFKVTKESETYYVECKRLAKVTDYSEAERKAWQKRWHKLAAILTQVRIPVSIEVIFKVPIESTDEDILAVTYLQYIQTGFLYNDRFMRTPQIDFKGHLIDIDNIRKRLSENVVKENSPMLIELITGKYDPHGSYTLAIDASEIQTIGPDDGLHVLNHFVAGIHTAYVAKWECIAEASIEQKAKDIKKILSKAVEQIPNNRKGIVHIGYETVNGVKVEFKRHQKIRDSIQSFDFASKKIESIYCHAIQPLSKGNEFECAETTLYFGNHAKEILPDLLLLDPPGLDIYDATHWQQDSISAK